MKKTSFLPALLVALLAGCGPARPPQQTPPAAAAAAQVGRQLGALRALLSQRLLPLARTSHRTDSLQAAFEACRLAYKATEAFTEYSTPHTSRLLNGPPLDELELEENRVYAPGGFQVMEPWLYPHFDTTQRAALVTEIRKMDAELATVQEVWRATPLTDAHLFDALRLQVFRLLTLGLAGFDTPLCRRALPETAASLRAMQPVLARYGAAARTPLQRRLAAAVAFLEKNHDPDAFDHATFIRAYANPLCRALAAFQQQRQIPFFQERRALRADAATLYDPGAFDADFYAPHADAHTTPAKVALGQRLFFDTRLSGDGRRSCASCHQPARAYADGRPTATALHTGSPVLRNTPTLLYAALQPRLFWDGRSDDLEAQGHAVLENHHEMMGSQEKAAALLATDTAYARMARRAFPGRQAGPEQLLNALAAYERSLAAFNSPFDRFMQGEAKALSPAQQRGFNLFMGKARCGSCHFQPLFGGTVPPAFQKAELEVLGVPATPQARRTDPDRGMGRFYPHLQQLQGAFKTPTLRNTARTAPYMHNGVYATLPQVMDFYNRGGGQGLGLAVPAQTLPPEPLRLSQAEVSDMIAFLKALNDGD